MIDCSSWAETKGMTLPTDLDAKDKATAKGKTIKERLEKLSGAQFDRQYYRREEKGCRKSLKKLLCRDSASNTSIAKWARSRFDH
jgi:hypothetical protein